MPYQATIGLIAMTRFGYGPRGDGDTAIAAGDPRGMLRAELAEPGIALLSGPDLPTTQAAADAFFEDQATRRAERERLALAADAEAKRAADSAATASVAARIAPDFTVGPLKMAAAKVLAMSGDVAAPKPAPHPDQVVFRDEALARVRRAIDARVGLAERLVAFWSNHFCISIEKGGICRGTAGSFEREAIRPHVLGRFADMLLAVESHPAMLHYLDNAQSVGPNSRAGQRGHRGLNENLGREIMELHTLGVGSGYTQADVTALARILTGWTYVGPKGLLGPRGTFVFNDNAHEPGAIALLGKTYPEDGVDQGRAALRDIARHPATARFLATKLARAFVSDDPPATLTTRLAQVFTDTDGDLRAMTLALIDAPEAWTREKTRMRTPYEVIVGAYRLLDRRPDDPGLVLGPLATMGMPLWQPPGPNGFPTQASAWASPEGLKLRLDFCAAVAARLKDPPNPSDLLVALCGGAPSGETRDAVARAESRQQGLALLLMSPEMQRS